MNKWKNKAEFKSRVRHWASKLDIEIKTVSVRPMKNKWASYTQRNDLLLFNSELLNLNKRLGDFVIVHELLHFRVPNHGKLWKSLMRVHLGGYSELELELRSVASKKNLDPLSGDVECLTPSNGSFPTFFS